MKKTLLIALALALAFTACENPSNSSGKTLTGITLNTALVKKDYSQNEELNLANLAVTAIYSDSSSATITNYITSPANGAALSTIGTITVTVSYTEGAVTKTADFTVTVTLEHIHNWGGWTQTIAPTCTTAGEETRTCTLDPTHIETQPIDALGHAYQWTTVTPPTCTTAGTETGICSRDQSHTETRAIAAFGHDWERTVITEPTETEDGEETVLCRNDPSHTQTRTAYATGTAGLAFELIDDNSAYRVRKGTVTGGAVHIPAYRLYDVNNEYLPITEIGSTSDSFPNGAFYGTAITAVHIPEGVTTIGERAFLSCFSLTSINIPASVTSIGDYAFSGCPGSITVDEDNQNYTSEDGILYDKEKSALIHAPRDISGDVSIPTSVTSIGYQAFSDCTGLTGITIPASVTTIGNYAFSGCTGLTSINIPASVMSIGNNLFFNCSNLTSITVGAANPNYASEDGILYNKTKTRLILAPQGISGTINIPTSVTYIESHAFLSCRSLTSVTVPASVTYVGSQVFDNWTSSQTIYIQGHANQAAADAAWGTGEYNWRYGCEATIVYQGS
jgi:hypothetical protein